MIPISYIMEWSNVAPWQELWQIEQDLIITTALIKLYEHPVLKDELAFRGGTALNKLYFKPPFRYSEDIDLVQISAKPIGSTVNLIQEVMSPWLNGSPKRDASGKLITLTYRVQSEDGFPLKLKFEINTREHFAVMGFQDHSFSSSSSWHSGDVFIKTYTLEELLSTKMRALYQRRKGRDLYDLYTALTAYPTINIEALIKCFINYTLDEPITKRLFLANIEAKFKNKEFLEDIKPLLPKHHTAYDPSIAYEYIREKLLDQL